MIVGRKYIVYWVIFLNIGILKLIFNIKFYYFFMWEEFILLCFYIINVIKYMR